MIQFMYGALEQRLYGEDQVKKLRVQRLKDMRDQDRVLTKDQMREYRAAIDSRKRAKMEDMKAKKLAVMKATHDDLANKWRMSLIDNGCAHRDAVTHAVVTVERIQEKENVQVQKAAASAVRGKVAMKTEVVKIKQRGAKTESLKRQRDAVKDLQASNREDARMAAETRQARAKVAAAKAFEAEFAGGPVIIKQGSTSSAGSQGAASAKASQGRVVAVQAKVMKHGATKADVSVVQVRILLYCSSLSALFLSSYLLTACLHSLTPHDTSLTIMPPINRHNTTHITYNITLQNNAGHEEGETLKRKFNRVLRELLNKTRAKARARQAIKTEKMAAKVDLLDNELQILQVMDRSGPRMKRVKSTYSVILLFSFLFLFVISLSLSYPSIAACLCTLYLAPHDV
jgi:hypothetical protein